MPSRAPTPVRIGTTTIRRRSPPSCRSRRRGRPSRRRRRSAGRARARSAGCRPASWCGRRRRRRRSRSTDPASRCGAGRHCGCRACPRRSGRRRRWRRRLPGRGCSRSARPSAGVASSTVSARPRDTEPKNLWPDSTISPGRKVSGVSRSSPRARAAPAAPRPARGAPSARARPARSRWRRSVPRSSGAVIVVSSPGSINGSRDGPVPLSSPRPAATAPAARSGLGAVVHPGLVRRGPGG